MNKEELFGLIWYGLCCSLVAGIGLLVILKAIGWV